MVPFFSLISEFSVQGELLMEIYLLREMCDEEVRQNDSGYRDIGDVLIVNKILNF